MKLRLSLSLLLLLAHPSAFAQADAFSFDPARAVPPGTTWHYTKSNRDGSDPWQFHIHFASPTRIDVVKHGDAADFVEVMADIDPVRAMPIVMQQWNIAAGRREPRLYAHAVDEGSDVSVAFDQGPSLVLAGAGQPLHVWGFDLSGLALLLPHLKTSVRHFELRVADPNRPGSDGSPVLIDSAHFTDEGEESIDGEPARRWRIDGPVFGDQVGYLWVHAKTNRLLRAEHPIPTSTDWNDWKLDFVREEQMTGNEWERFKLQLADAQTAARVAPSAALAMKSAYDGGGLAAAMSAAEAHHEQWRQSLEDDLNTFAFTLLGQGKEDDALALLRNIRRRYPQSIDATAHLAEAEQELGHRDAAETLWREVLKSKPEHEAARAALARD